MRRQPLTKRQREVFDFIKTFIDAHGYAPTCAEIGDAMALSSLATVNKHLVNLQAKGYIERQAARARSLTIVTRAKCPNCGFKLPAQAGL